LNFLSDESGATAIEYGLIAAGISLAISAATSTTLLLRVVISTIALDCLCSYTLLMIEVVLTNCQQSF
jgi:Flp pilus assembly pilin Flp